MTDDDFEQFPDASPTSVSDVRGRPRQSATGFGEPEPVNDVSTLIPLLPPEIERGRGGKRDDQAVLAQLAYQPQNDLGNACRFVARFGGDALFVPSEGWLAWNGRHWDRETGQTRATMNAQATSIMVRLEPDYLKQHASGAAIEIEKLMKGRLAWARESGNAGRIRSMLAQAEPHLTRTIDEFDIDRTKLAVANGTIKFLQPAAAAEHLEPEELFTFCALHDREDLMTHVAPVAFDPDADCPNWLAFLEKVQPDPEARNFLARLVGYCLTGLTTEECLVAFEGKGANGKSLFLDAIGLLLGSSAATIDFATLLADDRRSGANASPDLARLRGVRVAIAGEPERGAKLAEGRIKAITGGDTIVARKLHKDLFEYRPMFKLIVSWNTRPRVGGDDGIWRRILLLPWLVQILPRLANGTPNPEWRRKEEMLAEFRGELPGILQWALRGYADWRQNGLCPPEAVLNAVSSYREQSDPVGTFIAEACITSDPGRTIGATPIYRAFCDWSNDQGWTPMSQRSFGEALTERGFGRKRLGPGYVREGVALKQEWDIGGARRTAAQQRTDPPADTYDDVGD